MQRINYLDGHRGIAILLVMLFHAFSRWPELVPYTNEYAEFPLFQFGFLGVQLFFILSGFVILMTLEKCTNFKEFIYHRWLRLFPAMLICSLIIYFSADYFFERPNGDPSVKDLIPGLTFIDPYYLSKLIGVVNNLEDAFWSLYVEFKFYVISALLYFLIGSKKLVVSLFVLFILWFFLTQLQQHTDNRLIYYSLSLTNHLSLKYFGWFAAGASFYLYTKHDDKQWFWYGVVICILSSLAAAIVSHSVEVLVAILIISLFFSASLISVNIQQFLSNKFLLFLGYVSYPLYLLHENMMISFVIKFNDLLPQKLSFLLPVFAITIIASIAYVIAKYIEKPVKNIIKNIFDFNKTQSISSK